MGGQFGNGHSTYTVCAGKRLSGGQITDDPKISTE